MGYSEKYHYQNKNMITNTKRVQKTGSWWVGVPMMLGAALCGLTSASHAEEWAADKPYTYPNPSDMLQRHNVILEAAKKMPDANVIFIGDSITHFWENTGKPVWDKYYAPRKALNLGVSGDRSNGCMWRMDNGELDGLKPKLAVILIGTNNTWGNEMPVDASARGIRIVVEKVRKKLPETKVLLLGLLPREDPNTNGKWKQLNLLIAAEKFDPQVEYLDISGKFLDDTGKIVRGFGGDKLHLSAEGYQIWADAIESRVAAALGDKPNTTGTPGTPGAQPAAPGHLRHFDAKTVEQAQAWQRESVGIMAADKKMTALLEQRKAAGPEKEYGTPLNAKIISQADKGKFNRIEVEFDVFDNWRPRAIVTVPKEGGPFPAVVFIEGKPERPYESPTACGTVLAEAGYITLSLDVQGDRTHKPELGGHERIVPGIRAVDYLSTRPDVDREKIGVAGLCRWGALAVFDAHLDPRIKAVVTAACLFKAAPDGRYYATVNNDPHDFRDCYAMLAPRPLLVQLGKADGYLPMFPSEQDLADARKAYEVFGHPELFEIFWHPGGHMIEGSSLPAFFKKAFAK